MAQLSESNVNFLFFHFAFAVIGLNRVGSNITLVFLLQMEVEELFWIT